MNFFVRVEKFEPFLRDPHMAAMSSGSGGGAVWISRTAVAEMAGDMRFRIRGEHFIFTGYSYFYRSITKTRFSSVNWLNDPYTILKLLSESLVQKNF